ncbi:linoleate 9S-lipoxygenase [Sarracenia purpurea var. burkii]
MENCSSSLPPVFEKIVEVFCGRKSQNKSIEDNSGGGGGGGGGGDGGGGGKKIKGRVVLMKKNVLDMDDVGASFLDRVHECFGKGVSLQLISAHHGEPGIGWIAKVVGKVK